MLRSLLLTCCCVAPLRAQVPAVWRVEAMPVTATEGANATEEAELLNVRGAIRLASGHVVVANGKPAVLKVFAPTGAYLRTIGRPGAGPGEFRFAVDVHRWPGDTIHAVSSVGARHALFRLDGTLVREWTTQTIVYGAVAIHRRALLHVPLGGVSSCMRSAVDGLPAPQPGTIREVLEARPGLHWIRTVGQREWQIVDASGGVRARLTLPARFDLLQVTNDLVLGREFDEDDIERVAVYRVTGPSALAGAPACDGRRQPISLSSTPRLAELKAEARNLITVGEVYYARAGEYPRSIAEAGFEVSRDTDVAIFSGGSRGWAVAVSDIRSGVTCMFATGASLLVGYPEGVIQCGG